MEKIKEFMRNVYYVCFDFLCYQNAKTCEYLLCGKHYFRKHVFSAHPKKSEKKYTFLLYKLFSVLVLNTLKKKKKHTNDVSGNVVSFPHVGDSHTFWRFDT